MKYKAKKGKIVPLPIADFLVKRNLEEIEKDAWEEWGQRETPAFKPVPPMKSEKSKNRTLMQYLVYQWLP